MGKLILVTGGVRSGKSKFAEYLLKDYKDVAYVVASVVDDASMRNRIELNSKKRPDTWNTYAVTDKIIDVFNSTDHNSYIVDSMHEFVQNYIMKNDLINDGMSISEIREIEDEYIGGLDMLISRIKSCSGDVVIITSELGMGWPTESPRVRGIIDIVGKVNQKLGIASDAAWELVCGIPKKIK